ncbi:hypothetical protein Hore_04300 [Halothermothrix orenii H 168]|uniref:Uncharacterized protein n=1 Tax=Halothermothrix orenii (strain H 168 / OCM 544 / DSM 9562) TaxID=373903 RepID=B8D1W1_HALOH|nr:hypothetical protein Hore_04300 [Halothermothrix orenii H 168]
MVGQVGRNNGFVIKVGKKGGPGGGLPIQVSSLKGG